MSDIQHETTVTGMPENAEDRGRREAREREYQDVSLRAVELLANAQRAADNAVAEAQAYARDLEESAREQYRHILQRAQDAARELTGITDWPGDSVGGAGSIDPAVDAQQLEYVRTYARVAHAQLKAVLGALTDELDRLADLADGTTEGQPEPPAAGTDPGYLNSTGGHAGFGGPNSGAPGGMGATNDDRYHRFDDPGSTGRI